MTILLIPVGSAIAWLLAFAFAGAGLFNAIGGAAVQASFVRWGYPAWWNFVTAGLELLSAALIVLPENANLGISARGDGVDRRDRQHLAWRRKYQHLPPGVALAALTGIGLAIVVVH